MHDWTLLNIEYTWSSKVLLIKLLNESSSNVTVEFNGVEDFSFTHTNPWGESCSVNEFSQKTNSDGYITAQLEIQSGDVMSVRAASFSISSEQ